MVAIGSLTTSQTVTPFQVRPPGGPEAGGGVRANDGQTQGQSGPGGQSASSAATQPGRGVEAGGEGQGGGPNQSSEAEERVIRELKKRDAEVRRHEAAHASAGGPYAGSPSFEFQRGPDGGQYAVGGEVSIDTSPEDTPEETIRKMEIVRRAALAPADPSPQDLRVAAEAQQKAADARSEQRQQQADAVAGAEKGESDRDGGVGAASEAGRVTQSDDGGPQQDVRQGSKAGLARATEETGREQNGALDSLRQRAIAAYQNAAIRQPNLIGAGLLV